MIEIHRVRKKEDQEARQEREIIFVAVARHIYPTPPYILM